MEISTGGVFYYFRVWIEGLVDYEDVIVEAEHGTGLEEIISAAEALDLYLQNEHGAILEYIVEEVMSLGLPVVTRGGNHAQIPNSGADVHEDQHQGVESPRFPGELCIHRETAEVSQ